jgi:hypothetical protein
VSLLKPNLEFELVLKKIRLWTGLGLIFLVSLQIITGYSLVGKITPLVSYRQVLTIHTQFSWVLIYFFLTHATINLRNLFRKWWPNQAFWTVKILIVIYVTAVVTTLYIQFFK